MTEEGSTSVPSEQPYVPPLARRPSGLPWITVGVILGVIASASLAIGWFMPIDPVAGGFNTTYDANTPVRAGALWIGAATASIAAFFFGLGQIQKAMFFLPGREVPTHELGQ